MNIFIQPIVKFASLFSGEDEENKVPRRERTSRKAKEKVSRLEEQDDDEIFSDMSGSDPAWNPVESKVVKIILCLKCF